MFKYRKLDPTISEIRLLQVLPASQFSDLIACQVLYCSLSRAPSYHALSYTWGTPTEKKEKITLDGESFAVQPNLSSALRQFRSTWGSALIWADAVCINQEDNEERSQQVMMMGIIYSNAIGTEVWLGEAANESDLAMDTVEHWHELSGGRGELTPALKEWLGKPEVAWEAMTALWRRPWWRRVWVVQEVFQKKTTIACGAKRLDFRAFTNLWKSFTHLDMYTIDEIFPDDSISLPVRLLWSRALGASVGNFNAIQENAENEIRPPLFMKMISYRECEATDPRDKIYGVLGLPAHRGHEDLIAFVPNYDLSAQDLYKEFARYFISKGWVLDVLENCQQSIQTQVPGLASWAPDWSVNKYTAPITWFDSQLARKDKFSAAGDLQLSFSFSSNGDGLAFKGTLVSRIKGTTSIMGPEEYGWSEHLTVVLEGLLLVTGQDISDWPYPGDRARSMHAFDEEGPRIELEEPYICGGTKKWAFDGVTVARTKGNPRNEISPSMAPGFRQAQTPVDTPSKVARSFTLLVGRRYSVSSDGYIGAVPGDTRENDWICVFFGMPVPFIVREQENGFTFIGDCYISGLMQGEVVKRIEEGTLERSACEELVLYIATKACSRDGDGVLLVNVDIWSPGKEGFEALRWDTGYARQWLDQAVGDRVPRKHGSGNCS